MHIAWALKATLRNHLDLLTAQVSPVVAILKSESMDYDVTDTHRFYRQSEEHNASNSESLEHFLLESNTEQAWS